MRGAVPLIGLALAAAPLAAQNECSGLFDPALRPGCELAVDAYHTAQRVGGIAISGGDPEPGAIGVLGGLGRAFASVRVTGVSAALPNPDGSQGAISGLVPASVVTGGFGIFRGLWGGLLALDLLGSATLLPGTIDKLARSEEHTSELQSRLHLVCRLLLEKKKKLDNLLQVQVEDKPITGLRLST